MIQFKQVSKRYPGGFEALKQNNFSLDKGEMAFLTGHSGAGKSTMLKLIAGLEHPSSGQIIVNKHVVNRLKGNAMAQHRSSLGITFQSPHLLNDQTIFNNVALPLRIRGLNQQAIKKRVQAALDLVGLLSKSHQYPRNLSGGEQQRVGLARAVVHKPDLLLADEPTGNLDPALSADIMRLFEQLNQAGVTVLIATHDLTLIAGMPYRLITLNQGVLC